jgi:predicted amidophosphoribosyltransferase
VQTESTDAVHENDDRLGARRDLRAIKAPQKLLKPEPKKIVVVDDVLTTGAHFKAAQRILAEEFPVRRWSVASLRGARRSHRRRALLRHH